MPDPIYVQKCCCKKCENCPADCASCPPAGYLWTVTGSPTGGPCVGGFNVAAEAHPFIATEPPQQCQLQASVKWVSFTCKTGGTSISISSAPFSKILPFDAWVIESASGLLIFTAAVKLGEKCCWYEGAYTVFWQEPACGAGTPAGSLVRA